MEIRKEVFDLTIYGIGGFAPNKNYVGAIFKLSGMLWEIVKGNDLKNKGKNIWVYENGDKVFAGLELENGEDGATHGLETKTIHFKKYAYYKHVGTYQLIKPAGDRMAQELREIGHQELLPYIEIYGHWTKDEAQLETELLVGLE